MIFSLEDIYRYTRQIVHGKTLSVHSPPIPKHVLRVYAAAQESDVPRAEANKGSFEEIQELEDFKT